MASAFLQPSSIIGLMGGGGPQGFGLMRRQPPVQADAIDEYFAARDAGVPNEQLEQMYRNAGALSLRSQGLDVPQGGAQMQNAQAPQMGQAQRGRVNPLNVIMRGLMPNISAGLDTERARLQAEADRPAMLERQAENERIARAMGPAALLAFRSNPNAFGESVGYQYRPTTTGAGGVSTVFGTGQQVEAPRVLEFGNDLVQAGPISGTRTLATRGPSYSEQAALARAEQDAAQADARLGLDYEKLAQDQAQFDARLGFDQSKVENRPLNATQQKQLETYAQDVVSLEGTVDSINSYINQIDSGALNFSPTANASAAVRNRLGISDENSRNQALFRSDMERLRNESLRLNSGVQTEGDAQRAWSELFGNLNDEKVVRAQLERINEINQRALRFRQDRVSALEGGQAPRGSSTPALPAGFVLD